MKKITVILPFQECSLKNLKFPIKSAKGGSKNVRVKKVDVEFRNDGRIYITNRGIDYVDRFGRQVSIVCRWI